MNKQDDQFEFLWKKSGTHLRSQSMNAIKAQDNVIQNITSYKVFMPI